MVRQSPLKIDFKEVENFRNKDNLIRRQLEERPCEEVQVPRVYFPDVVVCSAIFGVVYAILF